MNSEAIFVFSIMTASFLITISIFNSVFFEIFTKFLLFSLISLLVGLYTLNSIASADFLPGQQKDSFSKITALVLDDSREISGGKNIFDVEILHAEDNNSTITSASGKISIVSTLNLFKGQRIYIKKNNLFQKKSSFIFIDKKYINIIGWDKSLPGYLLEQRAGIFHYLKQRIDRMRPGPSQLFTALFIGSRANPDGKLFTALRKAGASHILALSGMHLGIISFGILFLFTPLLGRRISFILVVIIIIIYIFIVKSGPSLTRGAILFILLGLFTFSGLRIDIYHILVICFLIQIIIDPESAWTLSFQLSYLALGGIILGSNVISRKLPGLLPLKIRTILAASISAQIFTAPLVLYYFGVIYPVGIISGIILVPLITIFIWIGIIGIIPLPWIIQNLVFRIMNTIYTIIEVSSDFLSQFPALNTKTSVILFVVLLILFVFIKFSPGRSVFREAVSLDGL